MKSMIRIILAAAVCNTIPTPAQPRMSVARLLSQMRSKKMSSPRSAEKRLAQKINRAKMILASKSTQPTVQIQHRSKFKHHRVELAKTITTQVHVEDITKKPRSTTSKIAKNMRSFFHRFM